MRDAVRVRIAGALPLVVFLLGGFAVYASGQSARPLRHRLSPVTDRAQGWHDDQTLVHDGTTRYFRFYVPAGLPDRPPVVFLFHGGTQSMRKIFRTAAGGTQTWQELADEERFLLIVPNGTNAGTGDARGDDQNWNDCRAEPGGRDSRADDVGFSTALIDWADREIGIDRGRVYATGASNGGGMTYRLAIAAPERFAAVAVFIMNLAAGSECGAPAHPVPILICNGTADPLVPWGGGGVVRGRRGEVISAADTLALWRQADLATAPPVEVTRFPDISRDDGSTVTCERFAPRAGGAEVVFCTVAGGGHTMPSREHPVPRWARVLVGSQNQDVEGARVAWEFLRRHRLAGPPPRS
ncbi:MAG: alpha/beta hydrolase family esterase [Acidobacteriota bacterium]